MNYRVTYALCFGKPICRRTFRGEINSFVSFVGVAFFLGGSSAMSLKTNTFSLHGDAYEQR